MSDRLSIEKTMTILPDTPSRIAALTANLTPEQLRTRPADDAWSVVDVLAHLRACSDVWGDCIATILAEDHPTIRAVNPRTWVKSTDYPSLAFQPSLDAFTAKRKKLLPMLEALSPEQWQRSATVTGAGAPLQRTVHFYAQWLARHERSHYKQFKQLAAYFLP